MNKRQVSALHLTDLVSAKASLEERCSNVIAMYQSRKLDDAEVLAKALTHDFPKEQLGWKILGAIFGQTGRTAEAVNANEMAVSLSPSDADAYNNLGITLKNLARFSEAEANFSKAISLRPDFAQAFNNLGSMYLRQDKVELAASNFKQALALNSLSAEIHCNFAVALTRSGFFEEAENSFRQAIILMPEYAEAYSNFGYLLLEQNRLSEAYKSVVRAIELNAEHPLAHFLLGVTLERQSNLVEAEASYKRAIEIDDNTLEYFDRHLDCLFKLGNKSALSNQLDFLGRHGKSSSVIGSLTCRAKLKYGLEKDNLFCREPLRYVIHDDITRRCNFSELFVENAEKIISMGAISNRRTDLLVKARQTSGSLLASGGEAITQIEIFLRSEITRYFNIFKDSKEGLFKAWPADYSLDAWLITMESGGQIRPHIHENSWLSGSIYINVPPKLKSDSGNLIVSTCRDSDITGGRGNEAKAIDVVTGSMVLFPSSLTHFSVPFEADCERIVLAFDVKPK